MVFAFGPTYEMLLCPALALLWLSVGPLLGALVLQGACALINKIAPGMDGTDPVPRPRSGKALGMVALAVAAGWWSRRSHGWRPAAAILCGVMVVASGSYAVSSIRRSRADVPETAVVDGKRLNLRQGRLLLYFFDPECTHCLAVAREMSKRCWGATRIVVLPTREPQFASGFLEDAGLSAGISPDAASLRKALPFTDPPYAVALDRGRVVATFNSGQMEGEGYYATLKRLGQLN